MGAGSLQELSKWRDSLTKRGPCYGYYPNAVKSLLIVKLDKENLARELFNGTNIKIRSTGACHLGATVGSEEFKEDYVKMKVEEMTMKLKICQKLGKKNRLLLMLHLLMIGNINGPICQGQLLILESL